MKQSSLIAALLGLLAAQAAFTAWVHHDASSRIAALEQAVAQTRPRDTIETTRAPEAELAEQQSQPAPPVATDPSKISEITYDLFRAEWAKSGDQPALVACWKGKEAVAFLHFRLTVDPDGTVTKAEPERLRSRPETNALISCVEPLVRKVRFSPSGKARAGRVQMDRPTG